MTTESEGEQGIARALGVLEGTVRGLMDQWGRQDSAAALQRRAMYDRLEIMSHQINAVANDTQNVQQDVAEMRNDIEEKVMPTIDTVKAEHERKKGARGVWVLIYGMGVAAVSALAYVADKIYTHWAARP